MDRFHGEKSVWPVIRDRIKRSKKSQQIFAAIAYIGSDAAKIMPLRRGDILVCNASDAAIKQGSTSAAALKSFFSRGVRIFNEPRLHGKVVVFPKRAFVGSANVSSRSRDVLLEAVIETSNPGLVNSSRRFVERNAQAMSRLDYEDIARILKIRVKRTEPPPPQPSAPLHLMQIPKRVPLLKLLPNEIDFYSVAVENEIRNQRESIRANFFNGGQRASIEAEDWPSDWWDEFQPDMWYVGVTKFGRIYKPRKIIKLSKVTKRNAVVWMAKPRDGKNFIKDPALLSNLGFDYEADKIVVLREERTEALLKLFREK